MLPMASGILEMFIRTFIISFFIGRIGFRATAYTEIGAWIGALIVNAYAFYSVFHKLPWRRGKNTYGENKHIRRRATT